jgi:endogenous inhibitor of DNA gyrase (YacG/DUF329 family)
MTEPMAEGAAGTGKCPICGRPTEAAYRPFCSKRCADVDLSRWLGGVYRVETNEAPDESKKDDD